MPSHIQKMVETKAFGCNLKGINLRERGYEMAKLEYLNFKRRVFL